MERVNQTRQGDVMLRRVSKLPKGAVKVDTTEVRSVGGSGPIKAVVLAHGEVTGHAHALDARECAEFTKADAAGVVTRFLQVFETAKVKHEEHATHNIPEGFYEIVRQREYSPEEIRNVAD